MQIDRLKEQGMKKLILDVREQSGGIPRTRPF